MPTKKAKQTKQKSKTKSKSKKSDDLDLEEVSLLDIDSNDGDVNEVLDISKTPEFTSDYNTLKTYVRSLDDTQRVKVFTEEFIPWFNARNKERAQSLNNDSKVMSLFNDRLKQVSRNMQKADLKKAEKKSKANSDGKTYGFCAVVNTPERIYKFLKKHCVEDKENDTIEIIKSNGTTSSIQISKTMKRSDITVLLYWYCSQHNLKNENDGRIITPDSELRKLFGSALKKDETLTFHNFQSKLKILFDEDNNTKSAKV